LLAAKGDFFRDHNYLDGFGDADIQCRRN
jgi:hypothetical protein